MTQQFYENYWLDSTECLHDFRLKWPRLKKVIPSDTGVVVVDFGCGNGQIIREMNKINPKAEYIGLDISETALKSAKAILPGCKFYKIEDGGSFPLKDKSVDFIFSSEVIEHVYDTENAFSEISRILKANGKLLLTTPYHGFVKNLLIALFAFDSHFNPIGPHIRFFSKRTISNLLKRYGMEPIKYYYYGRFFPLSHSIVVLAKKI